MSSSERQRISRLLIVEDEESQLRTLSDIFREEKFEVLGCSSAKEALKYVRKGDFGVAIVDLRLPDLNGTELIKKLHALDDQVRVIIHTAYASLDSAKAAVNLGAFAYIEKIGDPSELVRHVHLAFREHIDRYAEDLEEAVQQRTADLLESEQRFRQLAENIDDVFWLVDVSSEKLLYVSPAYEEVWQQPLEPLYQDPLVWLQAIHADDKIEVRKAHSQKLLGSDFNQTYRIILPDGSLRWIHDRGFPIEDTSGKLYRFAGIASDITERKNAEDQLRQREAELAHATRLTTMGEMAAELAHEINQPLYAISNFAQACINFVNTDLEKHRNDLIESTKQIVEQANRAGEIIRRLKRYVRKTEPYRSTLNINSLIKDVVQLLEINLRWNNTYIDYDLDPKIPLLLADRLLVEQVLVNLLRNGIEAMEQNPRDQRRFVIRSCQTENAVQVSISDLGCGVPEDNFEQLFQPFFTTKSDGLGMGLSICRSTIESHGGRLWAERNSDRGTTFHFSLPLSNECNHTAPHQTSTCD